MGCRALTNINIAYLYKMKKIILSLCILLTLGLTGNAQEAKSLLWRISGNGLKAPSYLFGTIHVICPDDYVWTDKMERCLDTSKKVCLEMDLDDRDVMTAAAVGFIDASGKKVKDYFKPADYQRLKKFMHDSIGMDMFMLQSMKPVALQSIISMKTVNCANAISYEETIMKKAKKDGKEILGLEQVAEQMSALDNMPADSVIADIMQSVDSFSKIREEFAQLTAAYKAQDLPLLYKKITDGAGMEGSMDALLDNRNKKWISRMEPKMKASSVFFAVGAGHLAGPNGVLSLLRKAGYKVEPVL